MTRILHPQRKALAEHLSEYIKRVELVVYSLPILEWSFANTIVKCDESRPSCLNCITADLSCGYRTARSPSSPAPTPAIDQQTASIDSPASGIYSTAGSPNSGRSSLTTSNNAFLHQSSYPNEVNIFHLELLHHMSTEGCRDFRGDTVKARQAIDAAINIAIGAPFLMHEILAISALHLTIVRPDSKEFYSNQAAELQTHALSLFNNLPDTYNSANPIPVFLFSSFLGIHVLFDTLLYRPADFNLFIDRFVGYLRLHRGVSTIAKGSYTLLKDTELRSLLPTGEQGEREGGNECAVLKSLMQSADLSQTSVNVCQKAIEQLQWVFDISQLQAGSGDENGEADMIFAWPVGLSPEFTELLLQKKPEALAILAHYAVLLHWRRSLWIIKDGGRFLIESIRRYLGSYWDPWLAFPISVLPELESNT